MAIGRPTKYTPEVADKIVEAVLNGATREDAAAVVGIHKSTLQEWMNTYPDFGERLHEADAQAVADACKTIVKASKNDWKAAVALLQAKRKGEWNKWAKVEVANADGKPLQINTSNLTDEQLAKLLELASQIEASSEEETEV